MKKLLKKSILFIMLLLTCIVFTGCNNADSYDDSEVSTLKVTVDKNLINGINASARASFDLNSLNLYFNGLRFQGHSFDSENNFVFTNVIYKDLAYELIKPATSTILITVGEKTDSPMYNIVCRNIRSLPTNMHINLINKLVEIKNGTEPVAIYSVNGDNESYTQAMNTVVKVLIEKYGNNLNAKVTFYNLYGIGIDLDFDSWKISALNNNLDVLHSWTKSENENKSNNLNIKKEVSDNNTYYIISLTSLGMNAAGSHNLDNTIVKIDYIRKDGKNKVDTGVLEAGMWDYRRR